jgi:ubiquinone/menaquinone biosynthesis C-methylase UbiE
MKKTEPLPDYKNLDLSGEAQMAAARMEARAKETASQAMFDQLVLPLLSPDIKSILEFGCGTAALARRLARAIPQAKVYAGDKSEGMLTVARAAVAAEAVDNVRLECWDVMDEQSWPFPESEFDLIISSVVIPYFSDAQTIALINRLSARLAPNGVLAFLEQDLTTDTVNFPRFVVARGVLAKDARHLKRTLALGLRPVLRKAGLHVLPRQSFLWTDEEYGAYTRDLLERLSDAAADEGRILDKEKDEWKKTLIDLAASGDFYYGIVYHLVAGKRIMSK